MFRLISIIRIFGRWYFFYKTPTLDSKLSKSLRHKLVKKIVFLIILWVKYGEVFFYGVRPFVFHSTRRFSVSQFNSISILYYLYSNIEWNKKWRSVWVFKYFSCQFVRFSQFHTFATGPVLFLHISSKLISCWCPYQIHGSPGWGGC